MTEDFKSLKKQVKADLEDAQILFRKRKRKLAAEDRESFSALIEAMEGALKDNNPEALAKSRDEFKAFRDAHFAGIHINRTWETVKEILWILFIVFMIRWLLIEPFRIPSGSMIPTLLVGDQLMVNKLVYGWQIPLTTRKLTNFKKPERGEVIVFKFPLKTSEDYVKRVVGLPGDEIMLRDGVLLVNGKEVKRQYASPYDGPTDGGFCPSNDLYEEQLGKAQHPIILCHSAQSEDFGPVTVPPGHVFGMGDNRDNSSDSRVWGFIPMSNIKGRAWFIHLPLDPERHYLPRWNRFFKVIR